MSDNNVPQFQWVEKWGKNTQSKKSLHGWAHPGMSITSDNRLVTCDSGESTILVFSTDGVLEDSWDGNFVDAHGITVTEESDEELIWIADNGSKRLPDYDYEYPPGAENISGRVFKVKFGGDEVTELVFPTHKEYANIRYSPTSVSVDEHRHGGQGDIWVSDGYGASLVHRYDSSGKHNLTIDGTEGAGRFDCPHGIIVDRRNSRPELYVADRGNARVQVFDLEGNYLRTFGTGFLSSPSGFVRLGRYMVIAELKSRLTIIDKDDTFSGYVFPGESHVRTNGWPNETTPGKRVQRPSKLNKREFNSPHGITSDKDGNLYVSEWFIGGRITKLKLLQ